MSSVKNLAALRLGVVGTLILFSLAASCLAEPSSSWVADKQFNQCLDHIARRQGWLKPSDFTEVKCHSKKISRIVGIEKFVNLKKLSLYKNNITQVNLNALQKLQHLNLARNTLRTLALKEMPELKQVFVFGNRLTRLSIENLPELEKLKASENKLLSFSYKNLPSLKKIYLFNNQLEDIDIYHLAAIKYMDVRQNPMSDALYEEMDRLKNTTILHDGNADDWD